MFLDIKKIDTFLEYYRKFGRYIKTVGDNGLSAYNEKGEEIGFINGAIKGKASKGFFIIPSV